MMPQNENTKYWRSLEQLENSPEFEQYLRREFPDAAEIAPTGVSRRRWMQLMGASFAIGAGAAGCRYPEEGIAPFSVRPENRIPGKPEKFATTLKLAGRVLPVVATSYDGRPIKVDGNNEHPHVSGSDVFALSSILHLYDPDRSRKPVERTGKERFTREWSEFRTKWNDLAKSLSGDASGKLAILHQRNSSPSVLAQMELVAKRFPQARWFQYDSVDGNLTAATEKAFGKNLSPQYHIDKADILVALDADILGADPNSGIHGKKYASRRSPEQGEMNRMYVVESGFTTTGMSADHRLAISPQRMASLVFDLEARVDAALSNGAISDPPEDKSEKLLTAMVNDLVSHKGKSLLVGGDHLDIETLVRIWRINDKLGNLNETVSFIELPVLNRENTGSIQQLTQALNGGEVSTLLVVGGNPVYDAPRDVEFGTAIEKAEHRFYYGDYENETSVRCGWHLPASHGLEQWGDAISSDGTYCLAQPLIEPIFDTFDPIQLLGMIADQPVDNSLDVVKQTIAASYTSLTGSAAWKKVVHDGFIADSAPKSTQVELASDLGLTEVDKDAWKTAATDKFEAIFRPGHSTYDGSFANNGWLQEAPEPITKVTWDNVLTINISTARRLGIKQAELVDVTANGQTVRLPAFLQPGQAADVLGLSLGYGRTHAGMVAGNVEEGVEPVGVDVGPLRTTASIFVATDVSIKPTGETVPLATTQDHFAIDTLGMNEIAHRVPELVREGTAEEYEINEEFAETLGPHMPHEGSLWTEFSYDDHKWGMSIDLTKCIGCNACTIACQSENNVPIVGKDAVLVGREMHWMRVDRYFSGDMEEPKAVSQPVTCHHCETAPCESVCPVAATVHSDEGLNDMVYNRCIGTRYCGNNCPYKVRRFNYLDWRASDYRFEEANKELAKLVHNPEVTVRNRGVMEKCTYCVQRIQNSKIEAKADRRALGPNEIKTACQEACASEAIKFGDLNNPESDVAKAHANPRAYAMLKELNVKPRTKYLARITNPHPWLAPEPREFHSHHGDEHGHGNHGNGDDHAHDSEPGHSEDHDHHDEEKKAKTDH